MTEMIVRFDEKTNKTTYMESIIRCADCEFAGDSEGKMFCSHPRNGGWYKREKSDFCSFGKEK